MTSMIHPVTVEQQKLFEDFKKAAQIVDAPFDDAIVSKLLSTYSQYFVTEPTTASSVMMRVTSKPDRNISLRYLGLDIPHEPYAMAVEAGLYEEVGHPIEDLSRQAQAKLPLLGTGVDFSASNGFEKIWPMCNTTSIDDIHALPGIPEASLRLRDFYSKHGLQWVNIVGFDYAAKTMNLYFFQKEPGRYSTEQIAEMFTDLGFKRPTDLELELCTKSFVIYPTLDWESMEAQRLCFCYTAFQPDQIPSVSPIIDKFVAEAPYATEAKINTFCTTYSKDCAPYYKLETDYAGRLMIIFQSMLPLFK